MGWNNAGSVAVTQNSRTIVGTGTTFSTSAAGSWLWIRGEARPHEIASVDTDLQITTVDPIEMASAADLEYRIIPVQGLNLVVRDRIDALIDSFDAQKAALALASAAALWVSGASYAAGDLSASTVDFMTYRAITAHAGESTDPANDPVNWVGAFSSFASDLSVGGSLSVGGTGSFSGNVRIEAAAPAAVLAETDTTTEARIIVSAGDLFIQAGAQGQGAATSAGDIRFTGRNGANLNALTARFGGENHDIIHAGGGQTISGNFTSNGIIRAAPGGWDTRGFELADPDGRTLRILTPAQTGDTEPYIFETGNSMMFRVDATDALFINGGGNLVVGQNLGIGGAPAVELHLQSSYPNIRLDDTDGTAQWGQIASGGGNLILEARNNTANGQIVFRGQGGGTPDDWGRFDENGNFAVGTNDPLALFHMAGDLPAIYLQETDGTAGFQTASIMQRNDQFRLETRTDTGAFVSRDYYISKDATGATEHRWFISDTSVVDIDADGMNIAGTLGLDDLALIIGTSPQYQLQESDSNFTQGRLTLAGGEMYLQMENADGVNQDGVIHFTGLQAAAAAEVHIRSAKTWIEDGKFGIGTNDPLAELHIAGGADPRFYIQDTNTVNAGRAITSMSHTENGTFTLQTRTSTGAFIANDLVIFRDDSGATSHELRTAGIARATVDTNQLLLAGGVDLLIGGGESRITHNDGAGNWNLRVGHYINSGHKFTKNGSAAFISFNDDNTVAGSEALIFQISNNAGAGAEATVTYAPALVLETDMLRYVGDTFRLHGARTISASDDAGNAGEICWDASYIYVCVSTNNWKRAALSSW